ncbi:cobalamin biosynthesis protein CbiX [Cereibacter sphaeroides]|uniref:CbiX/SirB N-terminal domain-containing protein n=1 Tax=Cereibacter sphaeroides TaxID=1063 RepID=UPI001F4110BC|nr:CbiX/SirB N-terminal domain-containing protein [Cereibacter sphaeroides]MCE6960111.1 cobalamin biosynthesis protein CbiX [Cereibacter sphaeroides]MCE6971594.1 cobalamin biosynthesis protein CbiX [Cereibacter sphaeroides]
MTQAARVALIVAHGQPSDPGPAAAEIAALAGKVSAHLPGWHVASATLAEPEALARAIASAAAPGIVYPLFMAGGWFTRSNLPRRLAAAGGAGWRIAEPFGTDPAVADLVVTMAREALAEAPAPAILLAAHGSFRSPAPSDVARAMADRLSRDLGLPCEAGFIDQEPTISSVARRMPGALCLPFFAARGGHVIDDLPAALEEGGFAGRVLQPVGLDPRAAALMARAIRAL